MRRDVRLLLIGDEGVGKSTIITSLLTESFTENIPHVLPEVTIPKEITPDNVNTVIVDSSSRPEDRVMLENEIRAANVIAVIYAVDDEKSFTRLGQHWLPYIRSLGANVPVVIVGNKIDTRGADMNNPQLEATILPLMNDFKEVETCVECSAKELVNIAEVFYFAQKAVLHPTAPLYDSREHVLKAPCEAALQRIFRLCDGNKDNLLDDEELNAFQTICFEAPLQKAELEGVKNVIRQALPEGLSPDNKVNLDGFLFLHRLFIQRGRLETTWTVLRRFGYEDDLSLREDYLHPVTFDLSQQSVELSPKGYQFLTELFAKFDRDGDGALAWDELDELFATCPGNPWIASGFPNTTLLNDTGALTLQGFLAQWAMTTLLEPSLTLAYLAHLGYGELTGQPPLSALKIIKTRRRSDSLAQRDVYLCHVMGAVGCGKSTLLNSFLHRPFSADYTPTTRPALAVNSVEIGGRERFLVLKEIGPFGGSDLQLLKNEAEALRADVVCLLYDASDANSFAYISALLLEFAPILSQRPLLLVATKSDCDLVPQRGPIQPDQFCRDQGLEPPFAINLRAARSSSSSDLFSHLLSQALHPTSFILAPGAKERAKKAKRLAWSLGIGAGTVILSTAIALLAIKLLKPKH